MCSVLNFPFWIKICLWDFVNGLHCYPLSGFFRFLNSNNNWQILKITFFSFLHTLLNDKNNPHRIYGMNLMFIIHTDAMIWFPVIVVTQAALMKSISEYNVIKLHTQTLIIILKLTLMRNNIYYRSTVPIITFWGTLCGHF